MKVQRSYKLRVYPSTTQQQQLSECFGIARFAFNCSLDAISTAYRTQGQRFSAIDCSRALTELKKEPDYQWLKNAPATVVTQSLRHLDTAFKNFFAGRAKYPRFKKKLNKQTATFQLDQRINNWTAGEMIKLPGIGCLKVRWSRIPGGRPKMATITRTESGKYFVSLSVEEHLQQYPATGKSCGVDVGIKDLAITHNWKSGAPKYTERYARELKIAQRRLSRKTKGSKRWHHARIKVARIHDKLSASRLDFIHKVSSNIVKNHDAIAVETLNVAGMLRNRRLSKAISDAAMSELHRQLEYKSGWHGRAFGKCDQWEPTSKTCSDCGAKNSDLKLSDRSWSCSCGATHDRDANASINIYKAVFGGSAESADVEPVVDGGCSVAA